LPPVEFKANAAATLRPTASHCSGVGAGQSRRNAAVMIASMAIFRPRSGEIRDASTWRST
jgi:hypothetical protein